MSNISIPIIIIELKITVPGFIEDLLNNRLNKRSKVNARITTEPTYAQTYHYGFVKNLNINIYI